MLARTRSSTSAFAVVSFIISTRAHGAWTTLTVAILAGHRSAAEAGFPTRARGRRAVTARAEIAPGAWTSATTSAIVLLMPVAHLLDLSPATFVAFALPALVWVWGHAVEQIAIGIERFDDVMQRRRGRDLGGGA